MKFPPPPSGLGLFVPPEPAVAPKRKAPPPDLSPVEERRKQGRNKLTMPQTAPELRRPHTPPRQPFARVKAPPPQLVLPTAQVVPPPARAAQVVLPVTEVKREEPDVPPMMPLQSKAPPSVLKQETEAGEFGVPHGTGVFDLTFEREDVKASKRQRSHRSSSFAERLIQEKIPAYVPPEEPTGSDIVRPALPRVFQHNLAAPALPIIKDEEVRNLTSDQVWTEEQRSLWFAETLKHLMGRQTGN